ERTAVPRQKTLEAAIDWSFLLLTEKERILAQRLAVFNGGCTLQAAEYVCSDPEVENRKSKVGPEPGRRIENQEVLDLMSNLVDKSLLVADDTQGEVRYRQLETVRQYCRERLEQNGEVETVAARHLQYYLDLA